LAQACRETISGSVSIDACRASICERDVNCEWLRDGCMYREELGIAGDNNCGRYRENYHEGTVKPEKQ
jgi:hypothetical protein